MKIIKVKLRLIIFVLLILFTNNIWATNLPIKNNQVWSGNYRCAQGTTNLQLKINEVSSQSTVSSKGYRVYPTSATFSFQSRSGSGSFIIQGAFSPKNRVLAFVPVQ